MSESSDHRIALVVAGYAAVPPPGIDPHAFADACLADSYEVLADLEEVEAGIAFCSDQESPTPALSTPGSSTANRLMPVIGAGRINDLLWPGDRAVAAPAAELTDLRRLARRVEELVARESAEPATQLLFVPADVPDLPGLVLAKVARALARADVCTAPELGGDGLVALGVRLPWPAWLDLTLDLDHDPSGGLLERAPRRTAVAQAPGWHRMRRPDAVHRLDPGLEGWDQVRMLLGG